MSSTDYIDYPVETDPDALAQLAFLYIQGIVAGWTPAAGNLDTILIEAVSRIVAELAVIASTVPRTILRYLGLYIYQMAPIDAAPATVLSTWVVADTLGHTIPANTHVGILDNVGNSKLFMTTADIVVPAGTNTVASVLLTASDPGVDSSGWGGNGVVAQLIDTISWVNSVTLQGVTSGGVDAETDDQYINRLVQQLRLMAPRPILPADFAAMYKNIAGVDRALAIDLYRPGITQIQTITIVNATGGTWTATYNGQTTAALAYNISPGALQTALQGLSSVGAGNMIVTGSAGSYTITFAGTLAASARPAITVNGASLTGAGAAVNAATSVAGANAITNNPRTVALAALDAAGNAVSPAVKSAGYAYLTSLREANFEINMIDPTYSTIDVTVNVSVSPGFDPITVRANVVAAIQAFLNPQNWGLPPTGDQRLWLNQATVYYLELSQAINSVQGVDHITTTTGNYDLTMRVSPAAFARADIALPGVAPLPQAGTVTVTSS